MRRLLVPVVALGLFATGCSLAYGGGTQATVEGASLAPAGKEPVVAVVHHVLPAVVNVTTDQFRPDQFGGSQQGKGVGTGFIVRSDGVVVTNCHVVEGASKITVFLNGGSGQKFDGRVIGGDCERDLAIVKIAGTGLPTVSLGDSTALQLGQRVVALGYALGLDGGPTVTSGIVSSLDRTITAGDPGCAPQTCANGSRTYAQVIQTDAAINPGNSGGPLVDLSGRVVGIDTAGSQGAENIGFAIPINSVKATLLQAERNPLAPSAYMGVETQSVTPGVAAQFGLPVNQGAYVVAVSTGSPAETAGIRQGEVIVRLDGQAVTSADELGKVLSGMKPGDRVSVELQSGSGSRSVSLTLGARPLPTQLP